MQDKFVHASAPDSPATMYSSRLVKAGVREHVQNLRLVALFVQAGEQQQLRYVVLTQQRMAYDHCAVIKIGVRAQKGLRFAHRSSEFSLQLFHITAATWGGRVRAPGRRDPAP